MPDPRSPSTREALIFGLPATTLALLLLFLAALDSFATVVLLRRGLGVELNPLMRWLCSYGAQTFVLSKLLITALCAQWIVHRANHLHAPYARKAALAGLAIYVPVVALHIVNNMVLFAAR